MQERITGTRAFAQRLANGEIHFLNMIQEQFGFSESEAQTIFAVYRKVKAVKRRHTEWDLTHGGYWERKPMERALAMAEQILRPKKGAA